MLQSQIVLTSSSSGANHNLTVILGLELTITRSVLMMGVVDAALPRDCAELVGAFSVRSRNVIRRTQTLKLQEHRLT